MANPFTGRVIAKAIGWVWVSYGALSLLLELVGILTNLLIHKGRLGPLPSVSVFWLETCLELFAVVSGFMLTRLRSWARITTQVVCLVYLLLFVQHGIRAIRSLLQNPAFPQGLRFFAGGSIALVSAIWATMFIACAVLLNLKRVKQAFPPYAEAHA